MTAASYKRMLRHSCDSLRAGFAGCSLDAPAGAVPHRADVVIGPYKRRIKMKKWLIERFLPMWAKETVLRENRRLLRENRQLRRETETLRCYIRGLHVGLRSSRRTGGTHEAS